MISITDSAQPMNKKLAALLLFCVFSFLPSPPALQAVEKIDNSEKLISLRAIEIPIAKIIEEIEEKSGYTIKIDDQQLLKSKKSLILDKETLSRSLKRLFRSHNYSSVYNEDEKTVSLVYLKGKSSSGNRAVASNEHGTSPQQTQHSTHSMAGLDRAFAAKEATLDHNVQGQDSGEKPKEMEGLDRAFGILENAPPEAEVSASPENMGEKRNLEMDGLDRAFERFEEASPEPNDTTSTESNVVRKNAEMRGLSEAFDRYEQSISTQKNRP